jgi:hypothetical protein
MRDFQERFFVSISYCALLVATFGHLAESACQHWTIVTRQDPDNPASAQLSNIDMLTQPTTQILIS